MSKMKWENLPQEIQEKMLERQEEQSKKRDPSVFLERLESGQPSGGFDWHKTPEGGNFWDSILGYGRINVFYKLYPKSPIKPEYHREFKRMFRVNKIPNYLTEEILEVLEENNVHKEWISE